MIGGKKWQKGQSGNPSGRPKSNFSFKKELEVGLSEVDERDYRKRTRGQIMVAGLLDLACRKKNPSLRAVNEVLDRLLGKPPQSVAIGDLNLTREQRIAQLQELLETFPALPDPHGDSDAKPN